MKNNRGFVYRVTMVAAVGGLLFGYDTAVIAGAIGFIQKKFDLSAVMVGWVASCVLVGCMIGTAFSGILSDRIGRKKVLMLSALLFAVSSVGTAMPQQLGWLVVFRVLGGIGVGIASLLAPMYISEIAPPSIRGRLVSINQLGIVTGILIIYFVNAGIAGLYDEAWNIEYGWRWMFASGLLPSAIFLLLLFFVPESPRWLAGKGREQEAEVILSKTTSREEALREIAEIRSSVRSSQPEATVFQRGSRKMLVIGILLSVFSQVTGINAIMYYAPEIFKSTGDGSESALLQTVLVGAVNVAFTLVAIKYVDRVGRKPLLLTGSAGMGVCLAVIGAAFYFNLLEGYLVLAAILLYIAFFAVSLGPLTFVVVAEIFPNRTRGGAMSVSLFALWAAVFIVSQFFPVLLELIGSAYTFWIFMIMCIGAYFFVWRSIPETKGKSLEEIERSFSAESRMTNQSAINQPT